MRGSFFKPTVFLPLFLILTFACGGDLYVGHDRGYVEITHTREYESYELVSTDASIGCSRSYLEFLDENYGYILRPGYSYVTISYVDPDIVEIYLEDLGIYIDAYYDDYSGVYYGYWDSTAAVYGCGIEEEIEIWIEYTGWEIYFDVINQLYSSSVEWDCPVYSGGCENIISFVGYPI